jgi:hypothetical protein
MTLEVAASRTYRLTMTDDDFDPFAGLADEPDPGPTGTLTGLLDSARRGYFPLRKSFVQKPNTEAHRPSVLGDLVSGRHHRPLDALLLLHALQPILDGSPLPTSVWARILSTRTACTPNAASKAFGTLVDLGLATRTENGRSPIIVPLREDGSREPWTKPGASEEEGLGYFTVPYAYWTRGYADRLTLPGKAMLLIILKETQNPKTPVFSMAVERAQEWYGLSERSAERGYGELRREGLLLIKVTKVADKRHPAGRREVYWRALGKPFGTMDRARLQRAAAQHAPGVTSGAAVGAESAGQGASPAQPAPAGPPAGAVGDGIAV